jgi:hypothetical protein
MNLHYLTFDPVTDHVDTLADEMLWWPVWEPELVEVERG